MSASVMTSSFAALLLTIAAINLMVSISISRAANYRPRQKATQIAMLWMVPVVGAFFCAYFLRTDPANLPYERRLGRASS